LTKRLKCKKAKREMDKKREKEGIKDMKKMNSRIRTRKRRG
jgi:hypothetical protein